MTRPFSYRRGSTGDAEALAALAARTFVETYRGYDEIHHIDAYVAEHFTVAAVATLLADPGCTTLLATSGTTLAGYATLRRVTPPPCVSGSQPLQLERFYLGAEHQGGGRGAGFLRAVQAEARRQGAATLWLGVYHRNTRAIRFYQSRGFLRVGERDFPFGDRVFVDPVYSIALEAIRFPDDVGLPPASARREA